MFINKGLFLLIFLAVSCLVFADSPLDKKDDIRVTPNESAAAEQIKEISQRIAVLQAQLSELDAKLNIAKKQDELSKLVSGPISSDSSFMPTVQEIEGFSGKMRATLNVQGGTTQSVRVGDRIGLWVVKNITVNSVVLQKGREVINLNFGSSSLNHDSSQPTFNNTNAIPLPPR